MSIGMGLGGFASGLASGMQLGLAMRKMGEENELKGNLKAVQEETNAKFGGELTDEAYAYMAKQTAATLMKAGRLDDARDWMKYSEEANTKANTKLFASGIRQIDTGDLDGFDKTLQKLGAAKGYGPEIGLGFARGEDGKIIANKDANGETFYRLQVTPSGAKEPILQDVPASRLKEVYARYQNPQAAWEMERATAADQKKRSSELADYEKKKGIDAKYADPTRTQKDRADALESLRKRDFAGKTFDDLPDPDKETAIQRELDLRRGSSGASSLSKPPGAGVTVDRLTGKPVQQQSGMPGQQTGGGADAAQMQQAPGLARLAQGARQGLPLEPEQAPGRIAQRSDIALGAVDRTIGLMQGQSQQAPGLSMEQNQYYDDLEQRRQDLLENRRGAQRMMQPQTYLETPPEQAPPAYMTREQYLRLRAQGQPIGAYQAPGLSIVRPQQ